MSHAGLASHLRRDLLTSVQPRCSNVTQHAKCVVDRIVCGFMWAYRILQVTHNNACGVTRYRNGPPRKATRSVITTTCLDVIHVRTEGRALGCERGQKTIRYSIDSRERLRLLVTQHDQEVAYFPVGTDMARLTEHWV
jgi:hypothetical protein